MRRGFFRSIAVNHSSLKAMGTPVMLKDTAVMAVARSYIGQKEIKGPHHNPHVLKWWKNIGAPFSDDETAWCGAFVGGVLAEAGHRPVAGGASARAWLKLPVKLTAPAEGAVVIFWRDNPKGSLGHVGIIFGKDQFGNLMVCGGNQGDAVTVKPFGLERVLGYRWPGLYPYPERFSLSLVRSDGKKSTNEA